MFVTIIASVLLALSACRADDDDGIPYYDAFTRNTLLPLAAAAYSDAPQACFDNLNNDFQLVQQVLVNCNPSKNITCFGYVAVSSSKQAIVIAYRGTVGTDQLEDEIWEVGQEPRIPFVGGGNVAQYFVDIFNLLWTGGIKDAFTSTIRANPTYQIWVTGHSLGGALASMTALYISKTQSISNANLLLTTFGQPRLGDSAFAKAVDTLVPNAYRVIHAQDVVPHGPPALFGFLNHMTEVFYDNDMHYAAYEECAGDESPNCSNSYLFAVSIDEHKWYFGKEVSHFGQNACISTDDNTQFTTKHTRTAQGEKATQKLKALFALTQIAGTLH